ncbi:hypothetical protein LWI28_010590 [Acer negundo]|uniref:TF-B3 domain-containing protein n=1 Tax=Acer negundo TaxID=4023 RepID=A0AAD5J5P0_ACENE|nr:hypothetical protein LWI28_010590 [Acer negundo]
MALPHFRVTKRLTYSDIFSKLELPTLIQNHMIPFMNGNHFLDLMAADIWGQQWPLRYYTRPAGHHKGPIFTKNGWCQFVEAKRLRVGDEFIFSGHQVIAADGELEIQYKIEVKRASAITFKGQLVVLDVEYLAA